MLGKNRFSLAVPVLALALALVPAAGQAAPAREGLRLANASTGFFSALVDWVSSVFAEFGVGIDPNGGDGSGGSPGPGDGGNSTTPPPAVDGDAGSFMDPNGTGTL
jgi:hypothetical protein